MRKNEHTMPVFSECGGALMSLIVPVPYVKICTLLSSYTIIYYNKQYSATLKALQKCVF